MKFSYRCNECAESYSVTPEYSVCPDCKKKQKSNEPLRGVLEVELHPESSDYISPQFDIHELLPIEREFFPMTPVGNTPLWKPTRLRTELKLPNLFIKDDGTNPSSSFKDRASFLVAAFAKKHKIKEITLASTGNAGSSMAGIGAAADLQITLFLPKTAPQGKLVQALQFGAKLILVDGNYDMAYDLSMEYSQKHGGINRNTAYNPMTIEGKKTVSLEIFKQMGRAPDYVFVPTGDGCIIAGVYKGFRDLKDLGLIRNIPIIYAVQAESSNAIARAFQSGKFENIPTSTIADSICVDVPRNGYHALKFLKTFSGRVTCVSDQEILKAQSHLSKTSGIFTEPAGATAYAGLLKEKANLPPDANIVILATGNGLKDTKTALSGVQMPDYTIKNLNEIK